MKLKNLTAAILLVGLSPFAAQAVTLTINADSHIAPANAGRAIGISVSPTSKGLLRFDLATLPEGIIGKDIAKATLVFFAKTVATGGKIQASPVLDAWDEATITTALAPKLGAPIDKSAVINRGNNYVALDVTQLVLDWVDNPISNNGLALAPLASSPTAFTLDSKEAIQTSHAAYIEITLNNSPGPKGDQGANGEKGDKGDQGLQGIQGVKGDKGDQGIQGLKGDKGDQGIKGDKGDTGPQGIPGSAGTGVALNPLQIAQLRWYEARENRQAFAAGTFPGGIAFDGANIWVADSFDNTVRKFRSNDGELLGTFDGGGGSGVGSPRGVAFDGANIWVTNSRSNTVSKLRASDGANLGTFTVGSAPQGVAFDGTNIWVTNQLSDTVSKLRASDGIILGTFNVGDDPLGVAFDGANIWVTNSLSNTVSKLRASDGTALGTFNVGSNPQGVAFDGANIWVSNGLSDTLSKLRASDGTTLVTITLGGPLGSRPRGVAFDGANIWVASQGDGSVKKFRVSDGAFLGRFAVNAGPFGVAFDGTNIWVTNRNFGTVSKL
jgi:hypothetical protein